MLKRVFITGANSGVGYELAKQYILRGDDVALFDLHFSEQTKQRLTKLADFCQYVEFFAIRICDIETLQIQVNNAITAIGKPELAIECSYFCIEYSEQLTQKHSLVSHHFATVITPYLEMNSHLALTAPITEPTKLSLNPALLLLSKKLRLKLKPSNIKVSLVCANKAHSTDVNSAKIAKQMLHSLDKQKLMVILGLQSKLTYIMSRYLPNWIMGSVMDRLIKQQLIRTTR
jgi:short-subunit dehydrogenase